MIVEGEHLSVSRLLLDGLAARQKVVVDGRRQITALHIPGDFVDLHSFTLKRLDHDVVTMTACSFAVGPHEALREITETQPHLTRLLWLSTMMNAAAHREWLVSAGRRIAIAQIANLLCEMMVRSDIVGLARGSSYPLPITQDDVADICGLTPTHVNRTLRELRIKGAIDWQRAVVTIHDWNELRRIAAFDPAYLILDNEPR